MIFDLSFEFWQTIFKGVQTTILLVGSILFTVIKTANPKYTNQFVQYSQRPVGGVLATMIRFDIKNKGFGIGKITGIGHVLIILHNDEERIPKRPLLDGGKDGKRMFPRNKKKFALIFDGTIQPEDIYEIQLTIEDEKSGEHFMKIRPNT